MLWTHIYDLLLKLLAVFLSVFIITHFPYTELGIVLFVVLILILIVLLYVFLFRTLATYLYCRLTLKMSIGLSQARALNNAFTPLFRYDMKWLPMREIKELDTELRYQAALDLYAAWEEETIREKRGRQETFKNAGPRTKALTVIMNVLVIYCMLAGFMNWPPANYLTDISREWLGTKGYYPLVNGLVLSLLTVILFRGLDKGVK